MLLSLSLVVSSFLFPILSFCKQLRFFYRISYWPILLTLNHTLSYEVQTNLHASLDKYSICLSIHFTFFTFVCMCSCICVCLHACRCMCMCVFICMCVLTFNFELMINRNVQLKCKLTSVCSARKRKMATFIIFLFIFSSYFQFGRIFKIFFYNFSLCSLYLIDCWLSNHFLFCVKCLLKIKVQTHSFTLVSRRPPQHIQKFCRMVGVCFMF